MGVSGKNVLVLAFAASVLGSGLSAGGSGAVPPPPFDTSHVRAAVAYYGAPSDEALQRIADTAATQHLLKHSAVTGYYPADTTAAELSRQLVGDAAEEDEIERVVALLEIVEATRGRQLACQTDALRHLPVGFRFTDPLYVTWGYDIGVSMNGSASINLTHPRFGVDAQEIWFYCTHEMHHAGFTYFHPFPTKIAEIRTTREMFEFIRYATALEGMAVHAARGPRHDAGALEADPDYVELLDPTRMRAHEDAYWEIYEHFEGRW